MADYAPLTDFALRSNSGYIVAAPAILESVSASTASVAGSWLLRNGSTNGAVIAQVGFAASGASRSGAPSSPYLGPKGILCQSKIYVVLTGGTGANKAKIMVGFRRYRA